MKTDITKKVDKLDQKIRELVAEKLALMVKEADSALEQLMKEHGVDEVRVVKSPFESEIVVPGIRFKPAGRDFRFTRFAMVNKVVHAKVQEIFNAGEEETFGPESPEWTPLYMLKKDADLDPSTLHLDELVQFLVDDEYAWKYLQFNEVDAMFDDDIKDPFKEVPETSPNTASNIISKPIEDVVAETNQSICAIRKEIDAKEEEITTLSNNLAKADNEKAITAYIINKMKQYGANQIFVREADDDWGYWHVDWLVYTKGFNTMAVRVIRLNEDDSLTLISNSYSDSICNDEEYWEYGDTDTEEAFSLKMFNNTLGFVLPFFQDEEIYTNYQTSSEEDD